LLVANFRLKMEKEKQLLVLCRKLIEQSLNWGNSITWGNDDFEQLSEKIFDKTKVQLSVSTLKRIWGKVRYENFPTSATLNALACYMDYENWRDFRQKNQDNESLQIPENDVIDKEAKIVKTDPSSRKIMLPVSFIFIFLIAIGFTWLSLKKLTRPIDLSKVKFEAIRVSDNLPNSVIFNYDIAKLNPDSVFIQQSWDPRLMDKVAVNGKQHTSIYYEPGFFIAKLIADGRVLKQRPLFIKTQGWKGMIEKLPIPIYLSKNEIKGTGYMGISDSTLRQKTGSPVFNDIWTKFANVREFKDIDAGNFVFETTLRNASSMEASVCRRMNIVLLGTGNAIIIPLVDKGCISSIDLLTGDVWISGKTHDLRNFGCDFSQFQTLKCSVQNHRFKIYLNDKIIMNMPQQHTLGEIVGIRFESEGAAQIKNVKLSTPEKETYYDQF
jgi:hypothetical protein